MPAALSIHHNLEMLLPLHWTNVRGDGRAGICMWVIMEYMWEWYVITYKKKKLYFIAVTDKKAVIR